MATFTTNFGTNVNGVSVQTGGMVVGVVVVRRGDRAKKRHALGKWLITSHRPSAAAAACAAALPPQAADAAPQWMSRSVERSMSRRSSGPAYELPSLAWAALVLSSAA